MPKKNKFRTKEEKKGRIVIYVKTICKRTFVKSSLTPFLFYLIRCGENKTDRRCARTYDKYWRTNGISVLKIKCRTINSRTDTWKFGTKRKKTIEIERSDKKKQNFVSSRRINIDINCFAKKATDLINDCWFF